MECSDRIRPNDHDYTTFHPELNSRFVETGRIEHPDRVGPIRYLGFYRWWVGDCAAVHITDSLPWTLVEVRVMEFLEELDAYRTIISRFDGHRQTLAGLSLGDELVVKQSCFFAVWGPGRTREDGEGPQKIFVDGSTNRRYRSR